MALASLLIDEGRRLAVVLGEVVIGDSRSTSSSLVVPSHLFGGWHRAWIVLKPWTVRLSLSSLNSTVRKKRKRKRKSLLRVRLNYYQPHFFATSPAKVYWGWYYYGLLFTAFALIHSATKQTAACWPPCLPFTFFSFTFPLQLFPPLLFVITINRPRRYPLQPLFTSHTFHHITFNFHLYSHDFLHSISIAWWSSRFPHRVSVSSVLPCRLHPTFPSAPSRPSPIVETASICPLPRDRTGVGPRRAARLPRLRAGVGLSKHKALPRRPWLFLAIRCPRHHHHCPSPCTCTCRRHGGPTRQGPTHHIRGRDPCQASSLGRADDSSIRRTRAIHHHDAPSNEDSIESPWVT